MASYKISDKHIIIQQLRKQQKKESDLLRLLGITRLTLINWINEPGRMRIADVILMAGFLKLDYEFLLYYLLRNKPIGKPKRAKNELAYIEATKKRHSNYRFID